MEQRMLAYTWPWEHGQFANSLGRFLTLLNGQRRPHNVPENPLPFPSHDLSLLTTRFHITAHCSMEMLRKPRMCLPASQSCPTAVVSKEVAATSILPLSVVPCLLSLVIGWTDCSGTEPTTAVGSPRPWFLLEPSKIDKLKTERNFTFFIPPFFFPPTWQCWLHIEVPEVTELFWMVVFSYLVNNLCQRHKFGVEIDICSHKCFFEKRRWRWN